MAIRIERLDHLVLTVRNMAATCRFYSEALGMDVITFGDHRTALRFGEQKINLHEAGREHEPKAAVPTPGSGDLCFITGDSVEDVVARLRSLDIDILQGPVTRTGAVGPIESVYVRDPDGNLIEISRYP